MRSKQIVSGNGARAESISKGLPYKPRDKGGLAADPSNAHKKRISFSSKTTPGSTKPQGKPLLPPGLPKMTELFADLSRAGEAKSKAPEGARRTPFVRSVTSMDDVNRALSCAAPAQLVCAQHFRRASLPSESLGRFLGITGPTLDGTALAPDASTTGSWTQDQRCDRFACPFLARSRGFKLQNNLKFGLTRRHAQT